MTEHALQLTCIGIFRNEIERKGLGIIIPVPNELAAKRKDITICIGCADCILIIGKRVLFIEFKVGYNNQQSVQIEFQRKVEELGYEYYVIKSVEQFNLALNLRT